jgi:hypothetical protein
VGQVLRFLFKEETMNKKHFNLGIILLLLGTFLLTSCAVDTSEPLIREDILTGPSFSCKEIPEEGVRKCNSRSIEGEGKVMVILPLQDVETVVKFAPIPKDALGPETLYSSPSDSFTLVTNFKVYEDPEEGEKLLTKFDPPFELRVEYTAEQWDSSQKNERQQPWLVYWSQENQQWLEFKEVEIDPVDESKENGGYLFILLQEWVDPPIGIVT